MKVYVVLLHVTYGTDCPFQGCYAKITDARRKAKSLLPSDGFKQEEKDQWEIYDADDDSLGYVGIIETVVR